MDGCLGMLLDHLKRRAKRALANQNYSTVKFYPHSVLTLFLQLTTAYDEVEKFAMVWCNSENLTSEVEAIKKIFETENKDDMVWMTELLSNKYTSENIDRLIYIVSTVKR